MKHAGSAALITALGTGTVTPALAEDGWALLSAIEIEEIVTETTYEVRKTFPETLAEGRSGMELTGYAFPISTGSEVRQVMLVSDMGLCPLCGSGEHGASVEVTLAEPLMGLEDGARVTLRGDMRPVRDPETWQSAVLENAAIVSADNGS